MGKRQADPTDMFGEKGCVQIYTGEGKGKTTAALGLALRSAGHGAHVAIIQFMKGWKHYGELKSVLLLPNIYLVQTGRPDYVYRGHEKTEDYTEAQRGMQLARDFMASSKYDMIILDEINVAIDYGLVPLCEVAALVKNKPQNIELILTGRNAPGELIELADLVTDMKEIKHPYRRGISARKGIEF